MKTSELTGAELNWAVALCEGWYLTTARDKTGSYPWLVKAGKNIDLRKYRPSTNWMQGGPIIEREGVDICTSTRGGWIATLLFDCEDAEVVRGEGETALIAAMRCYVAFILGDEVDVPEELKAIA